MQSTHPEPPEELSTSQKDTDLLGRRNSTFEYRYPKKQGIIKKKWEIQYGLTFS